MLVSAAVNGTILNCITWPVVSGSALKKSISGTPPPNGSSGPMFCKMISVPGARPEKSTMTSARSAGDMSISESWTGAGRKPPSVPICQKLRFGSLSLRIMKRELHPFSSRKR